MSHELVMGFHHDFFSVSDFFPAPCEPVRSSGGEAAPLDVVGSPWSGPTAPYGQLDMTKIHFFTKI